MFRFEHPQFLHLAWSIPVLLLVLLVYRQWRGVALRRLGREENLARLVPAQRAPAFWLRQFAMLLALGLMVVAAANPQRGAERRQVKQQSADVILAFDISQSMLCADVAPSRLVRAQLFAGQLVKALAGQRIGLVFFAGDAFLQMPLSTDYDAAMMFVNNAGPDLISEQGTNLPAAIKLAVKAFDPSAGGALILITDGENHDEDALAAVKDAIDHGIAVYAVGAGTPEGGPIPQGPNAFKRDQNNEIVRTKLNEELLKELAAAGKGSAFNIRQGAGAVSALKKEVDKLPERELTVRSYSEYESRFQYWLLPGMLLLVVLIFMERRRGGEEEES